MRLKLSVISFIAGISMLAFGTYRAMTLGPISAHYISQNYRIVFFHVPAAISSFLAFVITFIFSIAYLISEKPKRDAISYSSAKYGFIMITAALISGSIWAKVAWGSYWNWDPRETFVLILWFAYAAYFGLRASIEDPLVKAKYSAVYAAFAFVTVPLSYLSSKLFFSLHPTTSELKFDFARGSTLGMMILAFILLYFAYMMLEIELFEIEKSGGEKVE